MNRVQIDIQGEIYTFPINPSEFDAKTGIDYELRETVDGRSVRLVPFFDDRPRVMSWKGIPNRSPYDTLIPTLRSAIAISGVRMKLNDLNLVSEDYDIWKEVVIQDVDYRFLHGGSASEKATGKIKFNLDITFTFVKPKQDSYGIAYFTYQPDDYANPIWTDTIVKMKNIDMFICNPDLNSTNCNAVRAAFPNAKILTYYNMQEQPQFRSGDFYWAAIRNAILAMSGYVATFRSGPFAGDQVRSIDGTLTYTESIIPKQLADRVIYTVSGNVKGAYNGFEYDGVYIDQLTPQIQSWKTVHFNNFISSGYALDFDGDGIGEASEAVYQAKYEVNRNYFISGMRLALPDKIIIGNTAGDSSNEQLNGETIENITRPESGYYTTAEADSIFRTQDNKSVVSPKFHVAWAIHPTTSGGSLLDYCKSRSNILYGVMRDYWF